MTAQLLTDRLAIGHLRQQIHRATHDAHHIAFIQGGIGDQLVPGTAIGPGLHQAHQLRLPPGRNHHLGTLLGPEQLPANAHQVVECFLRPRRRREAAPEVGAIDLGADRLKSRGQFRRRQIIEMAAHQCQTEP